MELGGLRKKKGCFGLVLLSSLTWSLHIPEILPPRQINGRRFWDEGKEEEKAEEVLRVVPANAHDLRMGGQPSVFRQFRTGQAMRTLRQFALRD